MSHMRNALLVISILTVAVALALVLAQRNVANPVNYVDARTALTTTTATFGTLLGIITAGLMFTHGKYSELASELSEKLPEYLGNVLSLEKMQSTGTQLGTLRKTFGQLSATATVAEEKSLYERVVTKASSMLVDLAVLLNLTLKQHGLPDTGLLVSEMDPGSYQLYEKKRQSLKKEWQVLDVILQIVHLWEVPRAFSVQELESQSALQAELRSSIAILTVKEGSDKALADIRSDVTKTSSDIGGEISKIGKRLHEDGIPQLLSQMKHASTIRGKYFYLALIFIATPLLINLIALPQLSETTVIFFQPVISATSVLSVMGVVFLLLYIHRILSL